MGFLAPSPEKATPSQTELAQAGIAADEATFFKEYGQPLLTKERDLAAKEKLAPLYKGIAQADTMQSLTGPDTMRGVGGYNIAGSLGQSANLALGAVSQQLQAGSSAYLQQTKRQADVLAASKRQQFDASSALAQASRQQSSKGLALAQARNQVALSKRAVGLDLAMQGLGQGMANKFQTGEFFTRLGNPTYGTDLDQFGNPKQTGFDVYRPFGIGGKGFMDTKQNISWPG